MIRRPPRSTQGVSSAASDVYKRQLQQGREPTFTSAYLKQYNFIKDRFFEFEVDSPSKIQNLPLPVLNEGPFHFQFNYYKDDIILTVNFNGWYVRQYKMKA
eukprot:TRINITY_DN6112_c0_g1_i6.p1 TRINITY_DN6112_c0_g1~~TRINITY_DN6112_c0_g1_i6.p1  ORF type:complete len:101 (+),score=14.64 TRINITY_DN6112_c0_g1_i6:117-419(+)